jgi:hypothetical protein
MARVSKQKRQQVIERANGRCEYCHAQKRMIMYMEVEHIHPTSKGGDNTLENLCLACFGCNNAKSNFLTAVDPLTEEVVSIFNPRTQNWDDHFAWIENGLKIIGLTSVGRASVELLDLNREEALTSREQWILAGVHPPT